MQNSVRKFIAIDPGTTTGVVYADLSGLGGIPGHEALAIGLKNDSVIAAEYDTRRWWEDELVRDMIKWMKQGSGRWSEVPVVMEGFTLRTKDKRKETLDPIRVDVATVVRLMERGWKGKRTFQQPSQMTVVTDQRLRDWGLWIKGSAHCRDAMRHAVIYTRR